MSDPKAISLAPSSASRWLNCTASPAFIRDNADKIPGQDTKYNVEGKLAHETAEAYLTFGIPPAEANAEMHKHGQAFAAYCESLLDPNGNSTGTEIQVPLYYMPARHGYVDFFADTEEALHFVDLKYGVGVKVHAAENPQLMIYARSYITKEKLNLEDWEIIKLHIYQPRCKKDPGEETASVWELTWGTLKEKTESIKRVAYDILDSAKYELKRENAIFAPGPKTCQFCPAESFCQARANFLIQDFEVITDLVDTPSRSVPKPETLTDLQISKILHAEKPINKWLESVHEYAHSRAKVGKPIYGWKLVKGRGARVWRDEKETFSALLQLGLSRQDIYSPEQIISPFAAEELLDPDQISQLVRKIDGQPTLAPVEDKRADIRETAIALFEDLDSPDKDLLD